MLSILFIGEINGKIGRSAVEKILPELKKELKPDLIITNADNLAHGNGISEDSIKQMMQAGIGAFTGGNHCFNNAKSLRLYDSDLPILRPANYSEKAPGKGFTIIELKNGCKILLISLIGQFLMPANHNNPFVKADEILSNFADNKLSAIIIDIHAEATSEKIALWRYLDGRASAIIGSHTHIMTADAQISESGSAIITDAGMTGFADGILGLDKSNIIKTFLTKIKSANVMPENGRAIFCAVHLSINSKTKRTASIKTITKYINI
ncbi:MAG: TIGR00282 family metallophosphoesterase [bacterium]